MKDSKLKGAGKRGAKRLLRPLANRLQARFAPKAGYVNLTRQVQELERQVSALQAYVPELLGVVSSYNAALRALQRAEGKDATRFDQLERRVEFVRREILFEFRYGGHVRNTQRGSEGSIRAEILDPERIAGLTELRLNVGCGHIPLEGFVNVDMRRLEGIDVVGEAGDLPFDPGTVDQIHSAHLMEHFPREELTRRILPHWFERLKPGGIISAVVPDAVTMISEYARGEFSFDDLALTTFGEQEYEGDFHFTMFSPESMMELLEKAGFEDVKVVETGRRNGVCYEMEMRCTKPLHDENASPPRGD